MDIIDKKEFLKTLNCAHMAHLALEKVRNLDDLVMRGAGALPADDADRTVGKAMRDMTREVNGLIELALSRM